MPRTDNSSEISIFCPATNKTHQQPTGNPSLRQSRWIKTNLTTIKPWQHQAFQAYCQLERHTSCLHSILNMPQRQQQCKHSIKPGDNPSEKCDEFSASTYQFPETGCTWHATSYWNGQQQPRRRQAKRQASSASLPIPAHILPRIKTTIIPHKPIKGKLNRSKEKPNEQGKIHDVQHWSRANHKDNTISAQASKFTVPTRQLPTPWHNLSFFDIVVGSKTRRNGSPIATSRRPTIDGVTASRQERGGRRPNWRHLWFQERPRLLFHWVLCPVSIQP